MTATVGQIEVADVVWDPSIYPRTKYSTSTIERYADAIEAGDEFPPLVVERGTLRLLDGKHRLEAYKLAKVTTVSVAIVEVPEDVPVKLFAASLSARHGDRMSNADLKIVCREVYGDNPEYKGKDVAKLLGISEGRVSEFVSDLLAKRREERRAKALRLSLLGWTQAEIAERLGVTQPKISQDITNFGTEEIYTSGHTPDEIALRLGLPVQVVKAIQLKDATDEARMKSIDIKVQPYDVWQFQSCHDLMGDKHPGRIPGGLVAHVLYFYTKQGDLVIDPMAGSGTTLDACLLMGRKCRGFDIDGRHDRIDIEQHDMSVGWPEKTEKASLVFWDPPYFDKMDDANMKDGYIEGSISALDPDQYLAWFAERFVELRETVKPGATFAFLMSGWDSENAKQHRGHKGMFVWDYANLMSKAGWTLKRHISCPLTTQQVHPAIVTKFREDRRLARLDRSLLIATREG